MTASPKVLLAGFAALAVVGTAIAAPVTQGGRTFTVALTDEAETAPGGLAGGEGTATVTINPGQKRVCYDIDVNQVVIDDGITMAHIHVAPAGSAGPPVVTLFEGDGPLQDCVTVDAARSRDLARIVAKPANYYVNVHSTTEPSGAVRGQLSR